MIISYDLKKINHLFNYCKKGGLNLEKDLFLTSLALHLSEGGMPKDEVDKRVKYFNEKLSELSSEACEEKIKQLGGDAALAEKLLSDYRKAQTTTIPSVPKNDKPKKGVEELLEEDDDSDVKTAPPKRRKPTDGVKRAPSNISEGTKPKTKHSKYDEKKLQQFKILTWVLSPIILILLAVIFGLWAFLFVAVAAAALFCAVTLVIASAGGTAFALVSIIYGITQLGSVMPAGLYEIGMGIVCAGATMFSGILLYNFIVRLVPFIYKKLMVLVKFIVKQLKRLYAYAKGAFCKA